MLVITLTEILVWYQGSQAEPVQTDVGLWKILLVKRNATLVQRPIVPWAIALYGVSFKKSLNVDIVKEILILFCDSKGILANGMTAAETAKRYPVGFTDIANRVHAAAGMYFFTYFTSESEKSDSFAGAQ